MELAAHERAQELFGPMLDGDIAATQAASLRAHLTDCAECRTGFDQYEKAISLVKDVGRERAPEGFATRVLRRVRRRRRRSNLDGGHLIELTSMPAAEVMVPLLIAAIVAVAIIAMAP
jgi:anti-sigma factor RsiW